MRCKVKDDEDGGVAIATGEIEELLDRAEGTEARSRRGQKKRRRLPGWVRLLVTYSKDAWRQDGEAKSDGQNPLSYPPL